MKQLAIRNPTAILFLFLCSTAIEERRCDADVIAYLSETRSTGPGYFQADLHFQATADLIGDDIEYIELDISGSHIDSVPLTNFSMVEFEAAMPFDVWRQIPFGQTPGSESRMVIEPFSPPGTDVFSIQDTQPLTIGTFTFDYGALNLPSSSTITLDIFGTDEDKPTRTTVVGLRSGTDSSLIDLTYSSPLGGSSTTFVTAIPEPSLLAAVVSIATAVSLRRRRSADRPKSIR
ncbi:hypothetical protein [Roseiconus lacunae]|uniref:PEP-CTERM sorting domain-containing protein n=1 Tax=Roseiconus lacunae TaxID=2605694 RepID=A0ABT7PC87_9BACT|nr:hypothetical protein [Roseiconus lacunae]MDM4014100.1 hypothetical protein [Roseiconus lacunae]